MSGSNDLDCSHGLQLELARPSDAQDISRISRDQIETGLGWSWTPARVLRQISDRETVVLVARDSGRLVGFAIMSFGDEEGHLSLLAVLPSYRRRGLGRQMIQWLAKSASTAGLLRMHLEVRAANRTAAAFYQSLGFRETSRIPGYYRGVEAAVRMTRNLQVNKPRSTGANGPSVGGRRAGQDPD